MKDRTNAFCPGCTVHLRGSTGEEGVPEAGDLSACAHCGTLLRFEEGSGGMLDLVELTAAELAELPEETRTALLDAQNFVRTHLSHNSGSHVLH